MLDLQPLNSITLEGVLGVEQSDNKLELTLRAELLSKLIGKCNGPYSPIETVRSCLRTIKIVEKLDTQIRQKIERIIETI